MNKKTTYEITITERLQHLPLPDMEDAIWERVKKQLDIDLPTDDGGDNTPDAPSGSGWTWGAGAFIFVAALITIFYFIKNNSKQQQALPSNPVQNSSPATLPPGQQNKGNEQMNKNAATYPVTMPPPDMSPGTTVSTTSDSVSSTPAITLPPADSLQRTSLVVLPPAVQQDSIKPKTKTRGATGITNDDYRIVPAKKDSS